MAHATFAAMLRERGLHKRIGVSSAGTRVGAPGRPPDMRVVNLLKQKGIKTPRIRARQITQDILTKSHMILVMEEQQRDQVLELVGDSSASRVKLLRSFADPWAHFEADIPDPYFANTAEFQAVFEIVESACANIISSIESEGIASTFRV